mmetsp:Transcript_5730/g.7070  ORF Transcript_5730/g.7070 Transcript_5730/m.7070 type:complete len:96 (-) Transcript_5730:371-658(-)
MYLIGGRSSEKDEISASESIYVLSSESPTLPYWTKIELPHGGPRSFEGISASVAAFPQKKVLVFTGNEKGVHFLDTGLLHSPTEMSTEKSLFLRI